MMTTAAAVTCLKGDKKGERFCIWIVRELAAPQLLCPYPLNDKEYALTIKMTSSQFPP